MNKDNRSAPQPTRTELNILNVLWANGPSTVREVHEALTAVDASGYTTALKMLQVMHHKGLVNRDDSQRAHVYVAAISKDQTRNQFLQDLADRLFDGSTSQLVLQALGSDAETGDEELNRIRKLIEEAEGS
jgi:predicted transcriptional regulator